MENSSGRFSGFIGHVILFGLCSSLKLFVVYQFFKKSIFAKIPKNSTITIVKSENFKLIFVEVLSCITFIKI